MPLVSFIISTHNRREVLRETLSRLRGQRTDHEVLVVDNASSDGTSDAVTHHHPEARLLVLRENHGAVAKNHALPLAQGEFVVFLDDDSWPQGDSVARMVEHFRRDPDLGAAVFTVTLPDGQRECSAYPDVFIGCGAGFRASALREAGGLPHDFFMQAEEYDLSLRLLDAGWSIRAFDDLHVTHLKSPAARSGFRTMRLDVRNNLVVAHRHFPDPWRWPLALDWMRRYWMIATANRRRLAFVAGMCQGLARTLDDSDRRPIRAATFERFTRMKRIEQDMNLAAGAWKRVLMIDLGKNVLPYWLAARRLGLTIVAFADNRLAGQWYRGRPVVTDGEALLLDFDGAIIANSSPVHARQRLALWRQLTRRPVVTCGMEPCA